jgi:site-specific recombinase XerD
MVVNHFSQRTIISYSTALKRLYQYYNLPLESLCDDKLVGFVCSLKEEHGLSAASMRIAVGAIKYFYRFILHQETLIAKIPYPKKELHIKVILSGAEVKRLLDLTVNLKHRLILKIFYSAGLRRSEVLALRPHDFDWKNMQLTVHQGKGKKDRQTVLARSLHADYQAYIKQFTPGQHFFFGRDKSVPASENMLRWIMDQAVKRAGITKSVHLHTLRHSFASHLLSMNTDIVTVQKLLGHDDIRTTMAYLHLNHRPNATPRSPMDMIYK